MDEQANLKVTVRGVNELGYVEPDGFPPDLMNCQTETVPFEKESGRAFEVNAAGAQHGR